GLVAGLFEQTRHALGVVNVHLTAERLDQVFSSHRTSLSPSPRTFAFAFRLADSARVCRPIARSNGLRVKHLTRGAPKAIADRFSAQHAGQFVDTLLRGEPT